MVEIDFNKENEEDFSDPPGFVDDVTDDGWFFIQFFEINSKK